MNKVFQAEFIKSSPQLRDCPEPDKPEYAFVGRSNVGKSSLVNMLTEQKKLAKISVTPGKTQHINHFLINDAWYLADLPGYGYAKVSKSKREEWGKAMRYYIKNRENLHCVFVLIDCRVSPQKVDLELINWLGEQEVPLAIVFTKTDKPKQNELRANVKAFQKAVLETWFALPVVFETSSEKGLGRDALLGYIDQINEMVLKNQ